MSRMGSHAKSVSRPNTAGWGFAKGGSRPSYSFSSDAKISWVSTGVGQRDLVAHGLELVDGAGFGSLGLQSVEVVGAGVVVEAAVGSHVPDGDQH